jgi:hypothetical protein
MLGVKNKKNVLKFKKYMYLIDYLCKFVEQLIAIAINSFEIYNLFLLQITKKIIFKYHTHIIDKIKFPQIYILQYQKSSF